jgi:hypothetical protein
MELAKQLRITSTSRHSRLKTIEDSHLFPTKQLLAGGHRRPHTHIIEYLGSRAHGLDEVMTKRYVRGVMVLRWICLGVWRSSG